MYVCKEECISMCVHKLTYDMSGYQSSHLQHISPGVSVVRVPLLEGNGATRTGTTCDMVVSISPYNHIHDHSPPCYDISWPAGYNSPRDQLTYTVRLADQLTDRPFICSINFFLQETCSSEVK